MTPSFQYVQLTDIAHDDHTFMVTYRPDMRILEQSVARVGVLTPLHLRRTGESGYLQVVCGSKRLQACRRAGLTRVPSLIHDAADLSEAQAFSLAVHDNLGCRTLNLVEKGRVLQRLRDVFHVETTVLVGEWCALLGLPPRIETLEAHCTLVTLDDALQAACVAGTLPLETALWIGRHPPVDQQALLVLFTGLKVGHNRAREFAGMIDDIGRREDWRAAEVLQRIEAPTILSAAEFSGPQKLERIRRALHELRYPLFSAHEQRFQETVRRLRLPPQIKLRPPPYFEGQQYQVTFGFRSRQELQQVVRRLLEAAAHEAVDDLLTLL